ncbi:MAG TPA: tRNA pseudouridine(13) synthase TruD [Tepidisphaeraceae bacterium]|nr:tRNA pseudouridine(13) synthase TruD [Tepidisphaeraceae bacterium]
MSLPYLTYDFPGIGGSIKQRAEDFFVQEIPLYEPSGTGEHVYCEIQKINIPTFEAINRIGKALNISTRDIGYAGLKDAKAITRQVLSLWGTSEQAVMNLHLPDIAVQWAARHGNKLRLGHLKGNRFAIKVRNVNPTDVVKLRPMLDVLEKRGMPNFFGEQRFGRRNNNDAMGACLVRGRPEELLHHLLGSPDPSLDDDEHRKARELYDQGNYEQSMKHWPRNCGMERRTLAKLMKTQKPGPAVRGIDERLRRLWVSALQSRLFNDLLVQRIETIDKLFDGDIAEKHENGACFLVEQSAKEQPRCDAFEVSPTGPIVGHRMTLPQGQPLEMEEQVLKSHGLKLGHFKEEGRDQAKGARRSLRVKPTDTSLEGGVDHLGPYITVAFTLPAGSFATVLMRELMKTDQLETTEPAPLDSAEPE